MNKLGLKLLVSVVFCMALGALSGLRTMRGIIEWYPKIAKPSWNPPNEIFGPVWSLLYALMGIALGLIWHKPKEGKNKVIIYFIIQLALNLFWSILFFVFHEVGWAFLELLLMWIMIFLTIRSFYSINKIAAYLLLPYICWVSFAGILNFTIWNLGR